MKKENNTYETLKVIFIIIGAVVSIGALVAVAYTVFKKYFQVTFECDGDCCDDCDCGCFEEAEVCEPICCCADEEETCCCDCDCEDEAVVTDAE